MSGSSRSGARLRGRRRAAAGAPGAAVDPDAREAQALRGHVVVPEALRDVEDPLARDADPLEREPEGPLVGLVGPGLLRGDDVVERDAQPRRRPGEQVVVAVRDRDEPVAGLQARERLGRVGERRPVGDRPGERRDLRRRPGSTP